jgi:hypothetical protein
MITPEEFHTNISARRTRKIVVSGNPRIQNFYHTYQKISIPGRNKGFEESTYPNTSRSICASKELLKDALQKYETELRLPVESKYDTKMSWP